MAIWQAFVCLLAIDVLLWIAATSALPQLLLPFERFLHLASPLGSAKKKLGRAKGNFTPPAAKPPPPPQPKPVQALPQPRPVQPRPVQPRPVQPRPVQGPTKLPAARGREAPLQTRDQWHSCAKSCNCDGDLAFVAETEEAKQLFKGCRVNVTMTERKPALIVFGTVKGGTTSLTQGGRGQICMPSREPKFWSQQRWEDAPPSGAVVNAYAQRVWKRCSEKALLAEKSPWYFMNGAAHLRICEALGRQKLLILLREPVARAYSNFYEGLMRRRALKAEPPLAETPEAFHTFAVLETKIVKECNGLPVGEPKEDRARQAAFVECCVREARRAGFSQWPGCTAKALVTRMRGSMLYGDQGYRIVRHGVYAPLLRNWYRYHRAEDVLVIFSEHFFTQMSKSSCEMHCFLDAEKAQESCRNPEEDWPSVHVNSKTKGHPPILNKTKELLAKFYAPYNEELFALLGRRAPWKP